MNLDPIYFNATKKLAIINQKIAEGNGYVQKCFWSEEVETKPKKQKVVEYNVFKYTKNTLGKKGVCIYCEEPANTKDHFYPISKGGKLTVHCCYDCNQEKKDLTPTQWLMYVDYVYQGTDDKKELMKNNIKKIINKTKW